MKTSQKFVSIEEVTAGRPHKLSDKKLEALGRTRLDALGDVLQASHWVKEATKEAQSALATLTNAEELFRRRKTVLQKADRAFLAYVEKRGRRK
jgi:hypothetical protein